MAQRTRRKAHRRRGPLTVVCAVLALILAALVVVALFLTISEQRVYANVRKELIVEAGTAEIHPEEFLYEYEGEQIGFLTGITPDDLKVPGSYPVHFSWREKECSSIVRVVDTVKPEGTPVPMSAVATAPNPEDLVKDIQDATAVTVTYKEQPDMTKAGATTVTLLLTDAAGNVTELDTTLTVIIDTTAPVFSGVKPITIMVGSAIAYRSGITVTDDLDPAPTFQVNSDAVDQNAVGEYKVIYTATDASGNTTTKETNVVVTDTADLDIILATADSILSEIIKDGMTKRQQVFAIYNWARGNLGYGGHSDNTDYLQEAYVMMTKRSGDCYNYYAVTKLMLDRLGIDNIDVRKVKNHANDSNHFWSLVSLDDGKTWYHFDSTPRVGNGDDFCLVTDAFLDAYSDKHDKCHNRDKSLYPATPAS